MSIILDHVSHVYGEDTAMAVKALNDVNLVLPDGQFIGLIGHTGSGKSTLVQQMNIFISHLLICLEGRREELPLQAFWQ